jgi:proteasome lid subunit RPN8/RPN11
VPQRVVWPFTRKPKEAKPPPPPSPLRIRRDVLALIRETARAHHPHEFGGILRGEKGIITELLILPGTVVGSTHAIFQLHMLPIDFKVRGTVHSHPNGIARPSEADLELFRRFGARHIIIGAPYTETSWRAYDGRGDPLPQEIVDD